MNSGGPHSDDRNDGVTEGSAVAIPMLMFLHNDLVPRQPDESENPEWPDCRQ